MIESKTACPYVTGRWDISNPTWGESLHCPVDAIERDVNQEVSEDWIAWFLPEKSMSEMGNTAVAEQVDSEGTLEGHGH